MAVKSHCRSQQETTPNMPAGNLLHYIFCTFHLPYIKNGLCKIWSIPLNDELKRMWKKDLTAHFKVPLKKYA
jgi:hypothetical protein